MRILSATKNTPWVISLTLFCWAVLSASPAMADHSWGSYHWEKDSNPLSIELGDNVDLEKWGDNLTEASSDWFVSNVIGTTVVPGGTRPKSCRPTDGMVEVCSGDYGNTGWLGIAQIWVSGNHIVKGTTKVNDFYHDYSPYNSYSWKQLVMCQEIGHTFGLGHQNENFNTDETNSCMEYTSNPEGNEHPDEHDYNMLAGIYNHSHTTTGSDGGDAGTGGCGRPGRCKAKESPPAFDMSLPSVDQWGKLAEMSESGGHSVYVQDFGQGYKVITHVTWTLERAEQNKDAHQH